MNKFLIYLLPVFLLFSFFSSRGEIDANKNYPWQHKPTGAILFSIGQISDMLDFAPMKDRMRTSIMKLDTLTIDNSTDTTVRKTYTYGQEGRLNSVMWEKHVGGNWIDYYRESYGYNSLGQLDSYLWENWTSGTWLSVWRSSYSYNTEGDLATRNWQNWVGGSWVNSWRSTDSYDSHGNLTSELMEQWVSGAWTNAWKDTYTYNSSNMMVTYLWENWTNEVWVNYEQANYLYDINNNNIDQVWQLWQNEAWVNSGEYTYSFDSFGRIISEQWDKWINGTWTDYRRYSKTYDANGHILTNVGESWNNNSWINEEKYVNTYTAVGKALTGDYFQWDGLAWVQHNDGTINMGPDDFGNLLYVSGFHVQAKYREFLSIREKGINMGMIVSCLPNPVSTYALITIESDRVQLVSINLSDCNGRVISHVFSGRLSVGVFKFQVSFAGLPDGLYYSTIIGEQGKTIMKIILKK